MRTHAHTQKHLTSITHSAKTPFSQSYKPQKLLISPLQTTKAHRLQKHFHFTNKGHRNIFLIHIDIKIHYAKPQKHHSQLHTHQKITQFHQARLHKQTSQAHRHQNSLNFTMPNLRSTILKHIIHQNCSISPNQTTQTAFSSK